MTMTDDNRDTFLAERKAELQAAAPPVVPPCPPWCTSTAALHPLDFEFVDGVYMRQHEAYSGSIVNVEVTERSDGHGGPVTLSEPAIVVYGEDYKGEPVSSGRVRALASEMTAAANVRDRLATGCPSWCAQCDRDEVAGGLMHWSPLHPLVGGEEPVGSDFEPPEISAVAGQDPGQPLGEVSFWIRSSDEHFRSAEQTRAFAEEILSFVDSITGASVASGSREPEASILDDRGQAATLGGYVPRNGLGG